MSPGRLTVAAVMLGTVVACGGDGSDTSRRPGSPPASADSTRATPSTTVQLDAIAVLGHSGATGTMSDPRDPSRDATENSWATGENPQVRSVYQRLAERYPAMRNHNFNLAVNGSTVDNIEYQLQRLLMEAAPLPDVVIVQTIDNDMRCDGTDPENYARFGSILERMLNLVRRDIPGVSLFLVSQWASVETWATWASGHPDTLDENAGTGPCDVFTADAEVREAGVRSMQGIVDGYWAQVENVCAELPDCYTDGGAMQRMTITDRDVAPDLNHLSVEGHAKMAAIAWKALPTEIKRRR
ncbi:MAG TPA: SGNH/GDSL hydrolase family protein [Actinomycetes bacterium]